jgi:2-dehydropantoate 2-reductase
MNLCFLEWIGFRRMRKKVGALWAKLIANCAYNAPPAITQLPHGRLVKGEGATVVLRDLVDECLLGRCESRWRDACGRCLCGRPQIAETAAGQYASTAQDPARGKRSKIDHLNGFIVRRGQALGSRRPLTGCCTRSSRQPSETIT